MAAANCPVCQAKVSHDPGPLKDLLKVSCPRCGTFELPIVLRDYLIRNISSRGPYCWAITSHAIRKVFDGSSTPPFVGQDWLNAVWKSTSLPGPREQADILIDYIGSTVEGPGEWIICDPQHLAGLMGTIDVPNSGGARGFFYVVTHLENLQFIERSSPTQAEYRLTFNGWMRFDELRRGTIDSKIVFMAMGYNKSDTEKAFPNFVEAVLQTGFDLRRPDQDPKAGLIDNRIRVDIRAAKFLVADLSDDNRGAYWEAGFGEGLNKKVYYTCELSKYSKDKTHFDTEHHFTIKWSLENMKTALDELKAAIRNDFPAEAVLADL